MSNRQLVRWKLRELQQLWKDFLAQLYLISFIALSIHGYFS